MTSSSCNGKRPLSAVDAVDEIAEHEKTRQVRLAVEHARMLEKECVALRSRCKQLQTTLNEAQMNSLDNGTTAVAHDKHKNDNLRTKQTVALVHAISSTCASHIPRQEVFEYSAEALFDWAVTMIQSAFDGERKHASNVIAHGPSRMAVAAKSQQEQEAAVGENLRIAAEAIHKVLACSTQDNGINMFVR